jgi:hypothetical protein
MTTQQLRKQAIKNAKKYPNTAMVYATLYAADTKYQSKNEFDKSFEETTRQDEIPVPDLYA